MLSAQGNDACRHFRRSCRFAETLRSSRLLIQSQKSARAISFKPSVHRCASDAKMTGSESGVFSMSSVPVENVDPVSCFFRQPFPKKGRTRDGCRSGEDCSVYGHMTTTVSSFHLF